MNSQIVLIDDEAAMRESITQWLDLADFSVSNFDDAQVALNDISNQFNGVVITDLRMPKIDGFDVLDAVMNIDKDIPVVLITGHGDVNSAVQAIKKGAYDFIEKPFEPERLLSTISRAAEKRQLVIQNRYLQNQASRGKSIQERLIGECAGIRKVRRDISEFSAIDANVLLIGETGTGKEVIARCLHDSGDRYDKPFKAIDCGAIPSDRHAEELFGTDGGTPSAGPFELADGGTLLLDEVTNMPMHQQAALLRVLEQREVQRIGSSVARAIDVRLISAADVSMKNSVEDKSFRSDLYFRLNTLEILIPPLRERDDDCVILFDHFTHKASQLYDRSCPALTSQDITALRSHHWPGNVRELKNLAERYVLYQTVPVGELMIPGGDSDNNMSLAHQIQSFEKSIIEYALSQCKGNITDTAEYLGVPRRTLSDKLQRYDIDRKILE